MRKVRCSDEAFEANMTGAKMAMSSTFFVVTFAFAMCSCEGKSDDDDEDGQQMQQQRFGGMLACILFMVSIWLAGKVSALCGCPSLVGEVALGVAAGPSGLDLVPFVTAFQSAGDVGLLLLILEAGLFVDLEMIEVVGPRGLKVGVIGSIAPMLLAYAAATLGWGAHNSEAIAASGAMVTMSTGITLNVLKGCGMLNQALGQVVIAAATVNEVIGIVVLTLVTNLAQDSAALWYAIPLLITLVLVGVIGYAAIRVVPRVLDKRILPRIPKAQRHNALLGLVFGTGLLLAPACRFAGSSELLGAFLAGLCYCSDKAAHEIWDKQVKRVLHWLLRLFFATSIGFAVPSPARLFLQPTVLAKAALLELAIIGKFAMGFFHDGSLDGKRFSTPLAFAWSEFGEVSLVIAAAGRRLLPDSTYDAIVLAVLASVVVCPYLLRKSIQHQASDVRRMIRTNSEVVSYYYCIQTRSKATWDLTSHLARAIADVGCDILDFRSFHPTYEFGEPHCINEVYCKEHELNKGDLSRIVAALRSALGADCELKVTRWFPSSDSFDDAQPHTPLRRFLEDESLTETFRVEPDHELDGWIHSRPHRPFPDNQDDLEACQALVQDCPLRDLRTRPELRSARSDDVGCVARHVDTGYDCTSLRSLRVEPLRRIWSESDLQKAQERFRVNLPDLLRL